MRQKAPLVMFGAAIAQRLAHVKHIRRRSVTVITMLGVLITVGSVYEAAKPREVFWSRVVVSLGVPPSSVNPNPIKTSAQSLVMAAGAVARIVDPSGGKKLLADQTVTLASEGYTHATQVTLPNSGSQFVTIFSDQNLQVEAVGTTPAEVTTRMRVAIAEIHRAVASLEHAGTIPSQNLVRVYDTPFGGIPIYVQGGSRERAVLATAVLGFLLTALARRFARSVGLRRRGGGDPADGDPADDGPSGRTAAGRHFVGAGG